MHPGGRWAEAGSAGEGPAAGRSRWPTGTTCWLLDRMLYSPEVADVKSGCRLTPEMLPPSATQRPRLSGWIGRGSPKCGGVNWGSGGRSTAFERSVIFSGRAWAIASFCAKKDFSC